ncbi:MAG: hypothetical protein IKB67_04620 [Clostridia bacterium]|nr:hypothetical protein [Clostridia bacterium]
MRLYEITTDCLVDDCLCHWYVAAHNTRDAWIKGYLLAMKSNVADSGGVDCRRIKELPAGAKLSEVII